VLLGHLCLYTSQRFAAQQLPGVFQVPRTEEFHEPRETARLLAAVRRTKLATYGPLLRALVRLRPDFTAFGAEVDVDGFDGKRLRVRVAGRVGVGVFGDVGQASGVPPIFFTNFSNIFLTSLFFTPPGC
jgi:hypothetical protein